MASAVWAISKRTDFDNLFSRVSVSRSRSSPHSCNNVRAIFSVTSSSTRVFRSSVEQHRSVSAPSNSSRFAISRRSSFIFIEFLDFYSVILRSRGSGHRHRREWLLAELSIHLFDIHCWSLSLSRLSSLGCCGLPHPQVVCIREISSPSLCCCGSRDSLAAWSPSQSRIHSRYRGVLFLSRGRRIPRPHRLLRSRLLILTILTPFLHRLQQRRQLLRHRFIMLPLPACQV